MSGAPGDEISLSMSDAGSRVLASIRYDLAEGDISLRDAAEAVYRAMRHALSADASNGIAPLRYREQLPASVWREIAQTPTDPELVALSAKTSRSGRHRHSRPKSHAR